MKKAIITTLLLSITIFNFAQNERFFTGKGFGFGASIGISNSIQSFPDKLQNDFDFGLDVKLSYMLKPNIALLLTSNVSAYEYSGIGRTRKRDFGVVAPAIQYWLKARIWVLGGIGLGLDAPVFFDIKNPETNKEETKYFNGFGVVGALGYDIYQGKKSVIDLKARITYRNVNITEGKTTGISPSLLIGINFY